MDSEKLPCGFLDRVLPQPGMGGNPDAIPTPGTLSAGDRDSGHLALCSGLDPEIGNSLPGSVRCLHRSLACGGLRARKIRTKFGCARETA